jgi:hypothetical protein
VAQRFSAAIASFSSSTALQLAEKVGVVLDFGWRSVYRCGKCIVLNPALAAEVGLAQCYLYVGSESPTPLSWMF